MTRDLTSGVRWAVDELVVVGPLTVRIVSDVPDFPALRYFSRLTRTALPVPGHTVTPEVDAEWWCVSHTAPPAIPIDNTARARGFRAGYYVTDHFGPPVVSVTRGRCVFLFGPDLHHVVWPYLVKALLARWPGGLFLKAAAIELSGSGVLIVGRGGAGKTVMLTELCRAGAGFITNSHALIAARAVEGVASSLRIRPGPWLDRLSVPTSAALDPAEVVVDPADAFKRWAAGPVPVRHVVVVDYRGPNRFEVEEVPPGEAMSVLEQFGLGLNVYRLEEDLLDDLDGDYRAFARYYTTVRERLRTLVEACRTVRVVTDVGVPANRDRLLAMLGGA